MALVQYSDTESDTEESGEKSPRPAKKPRHNNTSADDRVSSLPPLPTAFRDLYASSTRVSVRDDPSLHGGRKRVIPHVEGNWPTHIYLEWYPSKAELAVLDGILSQVEIKLGGRARQIHSLLRSDLGVQLPLHISLSRPVVLRTEQRQPFMDLFQTALQESTVPAFSVNPYSLDWVSNYERTRWFLVLRVTKPANDNLNRLLGLSNRSLAHFGQPPLYAGRPAGPVHRLERHESVQPDTQPEDLSHCFHVSLAWSLTEPTPEQKKKIEAIDLHRLRSLFIHFDCVKAKIGNNISSIPLSTV
ncbi:putative U6 snRNA phosphodiesterase [Aspergillus udagawae]|nr:putative U6 snRNA phosphodiesterase [Aspergillus udagawae]GFG04872.1 putative U6 snRNA phosphodiesterase [Aspergillus udagawae]